MLQTGNECYTKTNGLCLTYRGMHSEGATLHFILRLVHPLQMEFFFLEYFGRDCVGPQEAIYNELKLLGSLVKIYLQWKKIAINILSIQ